MAVLEAECSHSNDPGQTMVGARVHSLLPSNQANDVLENDPCSKSQLEPEYARCFLLGLMVV